MQWKGKRKEKKKIKLVVCSNLYYLKGDKMSFASLEMCRKLVNECDSQPGFESVGEILDAGFFFGLCETMRLWHELQ